MRTTFARSFCQAGFLLWLFFGMGQAAVGDDAHTLELLSKPFAAPDFSLRDVDGKRHRLSDYRGKVVVLNFWATWCPPCRQEMPSMERAHQKLRGEDIVLLAIDVGEDEDTVFEFNGRYPVTFRLLLDTDGAVIGKYPVIGLPTTFVINPLGMATHRAVGGREWDNEQLLARLRAMQGPPKR